MKSEQTEGLLRHVAGIVVRLDEQSVLQITVRMDAKRIESWQRFWFGRSTCQSGSTPASFCSSDVQCSFIFILRCDCAADNAITLDVPSIFWQPHLDRERRTSALAVLTTV